MKKIIFSLLMVTLIGGSAVAATRAYFTSQTVLGDMTFATGTIELTDNSESWMTHVSFTNLKPGDSVRKWVVLKNTGTLEVASLKVSAENKTGDTGLLDKITAALYGQVEGFDQAIYTPSWSTGQPVNAHLTGVDILDTPIYSNTSNFSKIIPTGKKDTIIIDFKVPTDVDSAWQGKSAQFDLVFTAEQSHTGANYF